MANGGVRNFRIKMTELLLAIQRWKLFPDPKYMAERKEGGFIAEVSITIDNKGTVAEFTSEEKSSVFEATEDAAKKAIDSCTSTYGLNIVDYSYESMDKLATKYMVLEMKNNQLDRSNKTLMQALTEAQKENRRLKEDIMKYKKGAILEATGESRKRGRTLMKVKNEQFDFSDRNLENQGPVCRKLRFKK